MISDLLHGWIFIARWNQSMIWVAGFGSALGSLFRISAPSERIVISHVPHIPRFEELATFAPAFRAAKYWWPRNNDRAASLALHVHIALSQLRNYALPWGRCL
jgi:hypothetical protein